MSVIEIEKRAFAFTPKTIDKKTRTVEVTISTGAGVPRRDMDGVFLEILSTDKAAVDLSRADGMPVLDSHRQDGLDKILGTVRDIRFEGGDLVARIEFSSRAEAIWEDVKRGIIQNVSIGYGVDDFEDVLSGDGQRVRNVLRWTLHEVSLVAVGADAGAKVRKGNPMTTKTKQKEIAPAPENRVTKPPETRAETNKEIRALAQTFTLGSEFSDDLIDRNASVEDARAAALEAMKAAQIREIPAARVTHIVTHDAPEQVTRRMGEALYARSNPAHKPADEARPYMGMTTLDMARECLRMNGVSMTGLGTAETITRALHGTSDFPQIFADTANRTLRTAYDAAPAVLKSLARETTARDFRAKTKVQLGEAPTLEKVNEHGEYKYGSMAEAAESYKIDTFGKIIGLTRKAIVNDDLGAFNDLSAKFGQAAAEFEAQFLIDLLESGSGNGPAMADSKALFHADHGNKATSGGLLAGGSLSAARLAMRKQTGLSGKPINVQPRKLLVPPELETDAEMLLTATQPAKTADVNTFAGKLDLLVEARLSSATRWYMTADPAQLEGLEYAYLEGEPGPQIDTRHGFEVDGVEIKVRLDFGAAFTDWRGWYMNAGA